MNVESQFCGLAICILLLVLYSRRKHLGLYGENIFLCMLVMTIVLLALDIISVAGIIYKELFPEWLVFCLCKLYVVSLVFESCAALIYLLNDFMEQKRHKKISRMLLGVSGLAGITMLIAPIEVFNDGIRVYSYGPSTMLAYAYCGAFLLAILIVAFIKKRLITPIRWLAFMTWIFIWMALAAIQFAESSLLLVGFATSLGILILYASLENPEGNMNRELGCYNGYALESYLKQMFMNRQKFHVLFFTVGEITLETKNYILQVMRRPSLSAGVHLFKLLGPEFFLITENDRRYERLVRWLGDEKKRQNSAIRDIQGLCMENGLDVGDAKKLRKVFKYYIDKYKGNVRDNDVEITKVHIDEYLMQENLQEEIESALKEDRVEVFLQPIYSTCEKKFLSAEALVRIRKKDGNLLSPGVFIPVAEKSGSIVALGERVFAKVCQFISSGELNHLGLHYIEVNLSVLQCEQKNLSNRLKTIMDQYKVSPNALNLEITETATLNAKMNLLSNMGSLIDFGCSFSLDDFGKGESNLMYIVEMPVSIVKMDIDLTKAFFAIEKAQAVVRSVVQMAHEMGLRVVSEGIESQEEFEALQNIGVDYIQGYYFSRALPMDEFVEFVKKYN
ncbi:MAG: EAL domain-containing protein [Fibrobacteraceae bacterium]|nr:EAL domain-containing protein [Fibrobacteraceae bacterium]